ncbi:MAG: hypothetical protein ACRC53_04910 [Plesiomonas sp.]|uniref:hypothetical protein n=1 Tax=Plesiomonas sp. TaxID=2486279 RepID=UPI003F3230C3
MNGYKKITLIILGSFLIGCTTWPSNGRGGMAEIRPTVLPNQTEKHDDYIENINQILHYKETLVTQLVQFSPTLKICMPSRLIQLEQHKILIERELHARLWHDGLYNLNLWKNEIQQAEKDLANLQKKTGCASSTHNRLSEWRLL